VGAEGGHTNDPNDRGNWTTGIIGEGELPDPATITSATSPGWLREPTTLSIELVNRNGHADGEDGVIVDI